MKKKWMIICFFALLLLPNILGLIMGRLAAQDENTENRVLAKPPVLSLNTLTDYPAQAESYINDNAPFRSQMLDAYAVLNLRIFHSIDNPAVILGKDRWLFYAGEESLIDTLGVNLFTEEQCAEILDDMLAVRDRYTGNKEDFIFYIAPNKEIVYKRYMPDYYDSASGTSKAKALVEYIRNNSDIKVVYPLEDLEAASQEKQIFYKTDTHWNQLGGFVGAQALIEVSGGQKTDYKDVSLEMITVDSDGDLRKMARIPKSYLEETEAVMSDYYSQAELKYLKETNDNDTLVHIQCDDAPDQRSITLYCDSFARSMKVPIARNYLKSSFVFRADNESEVVGIPDDKNQVFVYEIVERRLGYMPEDLEKLLK